ncbi:recombinase family protein [Bacillus halotolerans]|uniref:recombinase family protein n=1 Tax=Bacillus halotolerans TaxID=260554 RepID=UPI0024C150D3|nr:recombinase family protein [Bacillus halotolerans]WHY24531.1 recombinase family protein [Bacillus halotolerans]
MVIDGIGVDNIAINLNQLGFRTKKGNIFSDVSVQRMIQSEIYKGWIVSNRLKGRNVHQGKMRPKEQWIIVKDAINSALLMKKRGTKPMTSWTLDRILPQQDNEDTVCQI